MRIIFSALVASSLLLCSCGPKTVISQNYDFTNVKRIGLTAFESPYQNLSGAENLFAKYFIENGFVIIERAKIESVLAEHKLSVTGYLSPETTKLLGKILGVDLLLMCEITGYIPEKKTVAMVETRRTKTEPVYQTRQTQNPDGTVTVSSVLAGQSVTRQKEVNPTEYATSAQVGVIAKLVDVQTAEVVWIGTATGQAGSSLNALDGVAQSLVKSFIKELKKQRNYARP